MARAVEWSLVGHGAVISYFAWKNSSDTSAETSAPVKARLVVQPNTTAQRDNPDNSTWDNPAPGLRNPTPKQTYNIIGSNDYPSAQQQFAVIAANAFQKPYETYSASNGIVFKKTYQCMPSNVRPDNSLTNGSYTWSSEGTSTVGGAVVFCFSTPTQQISIACPPGYNSTFSGTNMTCALVVAPAAVQKPLGKIPCEVLQNQDGTWDVDSQNPQCSNLSAALTKTNNGKTLSYNKGDGTYDQITTNSDGSRTVTTGNRTINIGPAGSDGNSTITGISDNGPSIGSGAGTGTGSSGNSGSNGTTGAGSATCGGPGLPACAVTVDDTGFQGKDSTINAAWDTTRAKMDERQTFIEGKATGNGNFGLDTSWIPSLIPGPAVTCQNLKWEPGINHGPLANMTGAVDIDWCNKIDFIREYYAWLIAIITIVAISMLFFSSNGNAGRSGK